MPITSAIRLSAAAGAGPRREANDRDGHNEETSTHVSALRAPPEAWSLGWGDRDLSFESARTQGSRTMGVAGRRALDSTSGAWICSHDTALP